MGRLYPLVTSVPQENRICPVSAALGLSRDKAKATSRCASRLGVEQTQILMVCLQLRAKLLTDSYSGSALGIKMHPQSRVPNLPYFEISRPATWKALPSVSVTDFISFFVRTSHDWGKQP